MLDTLVSNNTTTHSFTKQQISSILDQRMKDIDWLERDAENHKKEIEKLKRELERYQKRDSLQGEEITALKRLVNIQLNDELVRKVSKKRTKKGAEKRTRYCRVFHFYRQWYRERKTTKEKEEKKGKESSESEDEETHKKKKARRKRKKKRRVVIAAARRKEKIREGRNQIKKTC